MAASICGVGEGGFSGMTPCFRKMSFLGQLSTDILLYTGHTYHSVSAFGSSMGTLMRSSMGAAILRYCKNAARLL